MIHRPLLVSCLTCWCVLALPAMAQEVRRYGPGEAPSADEVARILGGCDSADQCDGVRTRQITVRRKDQASAPPAAGPTALSMPVQFELGSAELTAPALSALAGVAAGLAKVVQAQPSTRIMIEGHADRSGEEAVNQGLSTRRAAAVRDYLSRQAQIPAEALTIRGHGSSRPIPGTDPYAAANRRVEFRRVN